MSNKSDDLWFFFAPGEGQRPSYCTSWSALSFGPMALPADRPVPFPRVPLVCAAITAVGGILTLVGWASGVRQLTDWMGLGLSMMPNTATAFLLAGAAFWLRARGGVKAPMLLAILSGSIGGLTLMQHLTGLDLGIDRLLLPADWGQLGTRSPGRMGIPASLMFVLINSAFLFSLGGRPWKRAASIGAILCCIISVLSIVGYLLGARTLYIIPELTAISFNTALLFFLLGVGLIAALPEVQPMRTLTDASAAGALTRRALPVLLLLPLTIGWLRLQGHLAGLYDVPFGIALGCIAEMLLLMGLLWWMAAAVGDHESKLKASEEALRDAEHRYHSFVQQSSEGIWRCELSQPLPLSLPVEAAVEWIYHYGYLAECNDAMARMYGFTQGAELTGAKLGDLLPRNADNEAFLRAFLLSGHRLADGESQEVDSNGRTVYFSNNLVGIVENGALVRAWGTQLDITERKLAEEALRQADRRKDEFLATLAHELRNPLAPLRNGLEVLEEQGSQDPEMVAVRGMMKRQLAQMVRLVDELLDVGRVSHGKIALRSEPVDLVAVVQQAVEGLGPTIAHAGHRLDVRTPSGKMEVMGDATRLTQVVGNLLHNACKFTPENGTIDLHLERSGAEAVITVRDNGIGMTPELIPHIFDLFTQADTSLQRSASGLGIGLTLVERLVVLHGGKVNAHSEGPGKGSTFTLRLPLLGE